MTFRGVTMRRQTEGGRGRARRVGGDRRRTAGRTAPRWRPLRIEALESRSLLSGWPAETPQGLISWWTGDGHANDVWGGNDGQLVGGADFSPGLVGDAFSFDGADDFVDAPADLLPTGNAERTLELWMKAESFDSVESFLAGYGGFGTASQAYELVTVGDRLAFSQWGWSVSGPTLTPGQWYHVAVTNTGHLVDLYLNGQLVASDSLAIDTPPETQFYIGRIPGSLGNTRKLNGLVDEVAIYDRALTAEEILSIYEAGSSGKTPPLVSVQPRSGLFTTETGGTAEFDVVLTARPAADVTIPLSSSDPTEGTVWPDSMTFTQENWDTPQTVTVTGVKDFLTDGDVTYSIQVGPTASADPDFDGLNAADVAAVNLDRDFNILTIEIEAWIDGRDQLIIQDDTLQWHHLDFAAVGRLAGANEPTIVTTTVDGTAELDHYNWVPTWPDATSSSDELRIETWSLAEAILDPGLPMSGETVTLEVLQGRDSTSIVQTPNSENDHTLIVDFNDGPGGAAWYRIILRTIRRSVQDPLLTVTPTSGLATTEAGGTAEFSIVLETQPSADVTIPLSSGDLTEGTVSPPSLTFTADNWNVPQTVTVTGVDDSINDGDTAYPVNIGAVSSDDPRFLDFDPVDVIVVNWDDDQPQLSIDDVTIVEGTSGTTNAVFSVTPLFIRDGESLVVDYATADGTATAGSDYQAVSGQLTFEATPPILDARGTIFGPDNDLYMADANSEAVLRFDGATGKFVDLFVSADQSRTVNARGLTFGPDGNLYVASKSSNEIQRYDGTTGAYIDAFVSAGSGGLRDPEWPVFGPDGSLYVSSLSTDEVLRYDRTTGAFIDAFVAAGAGGLDAPIGLCFGPDGNLFVASSVETSTYGISEVLRYDGTTGAFLDLFVPSGTGGLREAVDVAFGPDGNLYVADFYGHQVLRYEGSTGAFVDAFVPSGSGGLWGPWALAFGPDDNLYVSDLQDGLGGKVFCYDGSSGEFLDIFAGANAQRIVVPVIGDTQEEPDEQFFLNLTAVAGGTLADSQAIATIVDRDRLFEVSPASGLVTTEMGGTAEFSVVLTTPPTADVTVPLSSSDPSEGTVWPAGLTFTTDDWDTPQTVTVTGVEDAVADGDVPYAIQIGPAASADPIYDGFDPPDVEVVNRDQVAGPFQIVSGSASLVLAPAGAQVAVPVQYTVSDGDNKLTGLGLRLHFDSSMLAFNGLSDVLLTGLLQQQPPVDDTADLDGDPSTDKYVLLYWSGVTPDWPGEALPVDLYTAHFTLAEGLTAGTESNVNFTASFTDSSYQFLGQPVRMTVAPPASLDVDDNGTADALTDGKLILRYLFGFTDTALTDDAVGAGATRGEADQIAAFLDTCRDTMLDVDANGEADALTDGILIHRYLFGFTGNALTEGAVAPDATRLEALDIHSFLTGYMRPAPLAPAFAPLGVTVTSEGADDGVLIATEVPREPNDPIAALVAAFEPLTGFPPSNIPDRPDPIDQPGGRYDPPPEAVDELLGSEGQVLERAGVGLDNEFISASHFKPKRRLAVELALSEFTAAPSRP